MSEKPRIRILDDESQDYKAAIAKSRQYFCMITQKALTMPRVWECLSYAASLGKPIRAFIEPGTVIPEGFFAPFPDCQTFVVSSPHEMATITMRLLEEMHQEPRDDRS